MFTIVGNGAIGNLLAFQCDNANLDYRVIARLPRPSKLNCKTNNSHIVIKPNYQSSQSIINDGIFILPLKAYQIMPAIEQFKSLIGPDVPVMLLHNGMVNHDIILQHLDSNPVIVATTSYGAFKSQTDTLNVTGMGITQAGWLRDSDDNIYYQGLFENVLPPCNWHKNILEILWRKLAVNCVINPLTALHNIKNGELAAAEYRSQITEITLEITNLMTELRLSVTQKELFENCMLVIEKTASNYSSMHQDIQKRRRTENENISGYVVSQGEVVGIPTPLNEHLYQQIKKIETHF